MAELSDYKNQLELKTSLEPQPTEKALHTDFSSVQQGDRVYDLSLGWGTIRTLFKDNRFEVRFHSHNITFKYNREGIAVEFSFLRTLFHGPPLILEQFAPQLHKTTLTITQPIYLVAIVTEDDKLHVRTLGNKHDPVYATPHDKIYYHETSITFDLEVDYHKTIPQQESK